MEHLLLFLLVPSGVISSIPRRYHFVNQPQNWTEAQRCCRKNFTDLATVTDTEETNKIFGKVNSSNEKVWIGLRRSWRWSADGSELNYNKWGTNQPGNENPEENCTVITNDGMWHDVPCGNTNAFLCSTGHSQTPVLDLHRCSWYEANSTCISNNTHLVSVKDEEENNRMKNAAENVQVWLGLHLSNWTWSDNSNSTFTNWLSPGPNQGGKHYCVAAHMGQGGKWNNSDCDQKYPFMCYEEKLILIRQNLTWRDAHSYCQQHHVDLVSVPSAEVDDWVKMKARSATTDHVWLGLYYLHSLDLWFWVESGETLCYDRWAEGSQGSEGGQRAAGAIESGGNHHWVSRSETDKLNFICTTF